MKGQCVGKNLPGEQDVADILYVSCSHSGELWAPFPDPDPGDLVERGEQRSAAPALSRMPGLCQQVMALGYSVDSLCRLV